MILLYVEARFIVSPVAQTDGSLDTMNRASTDCPFQIIFPFSATKFPS